MEPAPATSPSGAIGASGANASAAFTRRELERGARAVIPSMVLSSLTSQIIDRILAIEKIAAAQTNMWKREFLFKLAHNLLIQELDALELKVPENLRRGYDDSFKRLADERLERSSKLKSTVRIDVGTTQ